MTDSSAALVRLRGQLQTIKNNYALVQAGIALMAAPDARDRLEEAFRTINKRSEERWTYISYVFEDYDLLKSATKKLSEAVLRNCLKEMFELVKAYGSRTNQTPVIEAAPWYQFLRIIRNCFSHDMRLQFRPNDRRRLPITWSGLTIRASMHNKELSMSDFFTRQKAQELIDAVIDYLEKSASSSPGLASIQ